MNQIRVGIVDDNREFCAVVSEYIAKQESMEVAFVANNGLEALEQITAGKCPDVLILDIIMPHLDGFGVLENLNEMDMEDYPRVIMTSAIGQDAIVQKTMAMGAQYYLVKPINLALLVKRIYQLQEPPARGFVPAGEAGNLHKSLVLKDSLVNNDLEIDITNFFHEIGVPAHIRGYQYLRDAIAMVVLNKDLLCAVTKELYPSVAEINGTTSTRVERAIRHAIELTWDRGEPEVLGNIFSFTGREGRSKPTNAEFIAVVADKLRLEHKVV